MLHANLIKAVVVKLQYKVNGFYPYSWRVIAVTVKLMRVLNYSLVQAKTFTHSCMFHPCSCLHIVTSLVASPNSLLSVDAVLDRSLKNGFVVSKNYFVMVMNPYDILLIIIMLNQQYSNKIVV